MTLREKFLYHQIHPFKLITDISFNFISLYFFWFHQMLLAIFLCVAPSVIASILIIKFIRIDYLKKSSFGKYIKKYMNTWATLVRMVGLFIAIYGAWTHQWIFLIIAHLTILVAWIYGLYFKTYKR